MCEAAQPRVPPLDVAGVVDSPFHDPGREQPGQPRPPPRQGVEKQFAATESVGQPAEQLPHLGFGEVPSWQFKARGEDTSLIGVRCAFLGPKQSLAGHHAVTVAREDDLGVNHWPDAGYFGHYYFIGMPGSPIEFYGDLTSGPSRAVDYRIYLPTLMKDFHDRGGRIEYRAISVADLTELSAEYDLVVIGTGAGGLGQLFARDEQSSPFSEPQRHLCVGLFTGIAEQDTKAVTVGISPGAGEMIEIPTVTFGGDATALLFENHPGSDLEVLAHTRYDDNPRAFLDLVLDTLRTHYPVTARRVNEDEFDLANGATALLLGDAHATVDPVLGQGANMASYAAHVLGQQILSADVLDDDFVARVDARRADRVLGAARWTNFMLTALNTLPDAFTEFLGAVAQNRGLADKFTDNFNYPEKQWELFSNPDSAGPWIAENSSVSQESQRPFAATRERS